ncbi:MAG: hypothetical protein KGJ06_02780 [Pseudomonadota bacterium]|nr:hypothetical protein [Pseudomonadota bacterium]
MAEFQDFKRFAMRLLLTLILAAFLLLPPSARAGEALVNSEASVDVTGKDAADARSQAMVKGQRDALADLLGKLTTPEQVQSILNNLDDNKVAAIVRGTEVLEEKISSNRYRARLLVTFDGDQISTLIGKGSEAAQGTEATVAGSFLVLPGYEEDGVAMLWEENNPWMPVWRTVGLEVASGDVVVPFGDNADISVVDTKTLASATYAALAPLTIRYGISDIVLLQAKFTHTPDMVLTVVKRRVNRTSNEVNLLTYRADPQETKDMLLARAARDIIDSLQHKKSEEAESVKLVHGGERNTVMVLASITTLASWTQLRAKLQSLPMIDKIDLIAMSPQQVDMLVHYRGTPDSLANGISAQNLRLVKGSNYWVISYD